MVVKAVAFDLDDTLCDWEAGIDAALTRICDARTAARFRQAVRDSAWLRQNGSILSRRHWMTRRDPISFWSAALGAGRAQEAERLSDEYLRALELPLFDDAAPALDRLHGRIPLALLSNAPGALDRARGLGILDRFEVALSAAEQKKPHPAAFSTLLSELRLEAHEVAYVGDDPLEDVEGAARAGMAAVWLDRIDSTWQPPSGTLRITTLDELDRALGL